jgi:signal transduction histidine kinase
VSASTGTGVARTLSPALNQARTPLAQLLHALNQPLTGLQCSMEVALATPRTPEQYTHGLRENLELTERMRALVEAIREVVDAQESHTAFETFDFGLLLRETVDGLIPVAESRNTTLRLSGGAFPSPALETLATDLSLSVHSERATVSTSLFRLLDSALSLAARASPFYVEAGSESGAVTLRLRWDRARSLSIFSRPELGLLVAQAGFEQAGAEWKRERMEMTEAVTVRLPGASQSSQTHLRGTKL